MLLTTLVDIIEKRPNPSPFGTQYIALLGAAWGPAVVFCKYTLNRLDYISLIWLQHIYLAFEGSLCFGNDDWEKYRKLDNSKCITTFV